MSLFKQFTIIKKLSKNYYDLLEKEIQLKNPCKRDVDKERIGFYLLMLENICEVGDISEQLECIVDTDFLNVTKGEKQNDFGIDAVYIDPTNSTINLFSFKYREKFSREKNQESNPTIISSKFLNKIDSNSIEKEDTTIGKKIGEIKEANDSNVLWDYVLYIVSNEARPLKVDMSEIKDFQEYYGLKVEPIALPQIQDLMTLRPSPIDANLVIERESIMSYQEDDISSSKSYIAKVKCNELIRITCDNKIKREDHEETISGNDRLDFGVLFDNVRGYIAKSKFNKNIFNTIKEEPSKLFMYNNGITIITNGIKVDEYNAKRKYKISLRDFQVVNGGQTLRTLHDYNSIDDIEVDKSNLSNSEILIRIFNIEKEDTLITNKIAEYTNSQNSISQSDLKSLSNEQLEIEQYLAAEGIHYSRRRGDLGIDNSNFKFRITSEKFGQLLMSNLGYPEKAINQKKDIFGKFYNKVFIENFHIENSHVLVELYNDVLKHYSNSPCMKGIEIKYLYVIFLMSFYEDMEIGYAAELIELTLTDYISNKEKTIPRKMIEKGFKDSLISRAGETFKCIEPLV